MSRILHVADLHLRWFDWVASHCTDFDLLLVAGDLQDAFSDQPMHAQAKTINIWLASLGTPTCITTGNHDVWPSRGSTDVYADGRWLKLVRGRGNVIGVPGDTVTFDGVRIHCHGWLQVPDLSEPVDIILTHAPIADTAAAAGADGGPDVGDPELWPAIAEAEKPPRIVCAGHCHNPRRLACQWPPIDPTTTILVPGFDENSAVPSHWIIDTDRYTAVHSSGQEVSW